MEFAPSFFEGEEREGFYVQPLMKRAWAAQLEVLKEIDVICKRHNIKYFAEWGTLLGAVRHKGFIPWDDDMDIGMLREDFMKFLHYARREIPEGWRLVDIHDEGYNELMARVVNSDTMRPQDEEFLKKFHGCPYCSGVDIGCLDHIPKNKEDEAILLNWLQVANVLGNYWDTDEIMTMEEKWDAVKALEQQTGFRFQKDAPMKKQLLVLSDKISAMYYDDPESDEVSLMCMLTFNPKCRIPLSCYDKIIEVPFENTTIPIPAEYDGVLKAWYGDDYMTPIRDYYDENSHEYPYLKKQVEQLREAYAQQGLEMPEGFEWKE